MNYSKNDLRKSLNFFKKLREIGIKITDWDECGNYEIITEGESERHWFTEQELIDFLFELDFLKY